MRLHACPRCDHEYECDTENDDADALIGAVIRKYGLEPCPPDHVAQLLVERIDAAMPAGTIYAVGQTIPTLLRDCRAFFTRQGGKT